MKHISKFRWMMGILTLALLFVLTAGAAGATRANSEAQTGAVYALTNEAAGNQVAAYQRSTDGTLTPLGTFATGGLGTGAGLGSQGALVLSEDHHLLFAVNAGSHEISTFAVNSNRLRLVDKVSSGGSTPISLTQHGNWLYVLNAGDGGNITGFQVSSSGRLRALSGSTRSLSGAGVGPAQISFSPDGSTLIVTEKATQLIDVYTVDDNGYASQPVSYPSAGPTPFGFAFQPGTNVLVVSEAFGGAAGASAVSSYTLDAGTLQVASASVATTQTAACWIAIPVSLPYAYTTNAGSGTISSYTIAADGSLTLLNAVAADDGAGSVPVDMATSENGQYLYVRNGGLGTIDAYQIMSDGSLVHIDNDGGLPLIGVAGLAAR